MGIGGSIMAGAMKKLGAKKAGDKSSPKKKKKGMTGGQVMAGIGKVADHMSKSRSASKAQTQTRSSKRSQGSTSYPSRRARASQKMQGGGRQRRNFTKR